MKNIFHNSYILVLLLLFSKTAIAEQFIRAEPYSMRWTMALSQSAVDDWKQGNVKSIEVASSMDLRTRFRIDTLLLKINLKYGAGMLYKKDEKNNYENLLPTDNMIFGEGILTYPLGWKLDPFFSASFKSQITESIRVMNGNKTATASLWDPVTSMESWGFEYSLKMDAGTFLSRLGFSLKQVRAYKFTTMTDDYKTKDIKERYKPTSGIHWKSEANFNMDKSSNYRGTLELYSSFDDLTKWTVAFNNQFKFQVFKSIAILFNINLCYDESQLMKTQYIQNIRFGLVIDRK